MKHKPTVRYFRIIMICYVLLAGVMILCGLFGFYRFIEDYEKNLPAHTMDDFLKKAQENGGATIFRENLKISLSPFETPETVAAALFSGQAGTPEMGYKRSSLDYKDSAPVYILQWGSKDLAKIFLEEKKKSEYGFSVWEIAKTEPLLEITPSFSVKVSLPEGATLFINGIPAGEEYRDKEAQLPEALKEASSYVDTLPKLQSYSFSGLYLRPQITAFMADGTELSVQQGENSVSFAFPPSESLKTSMEGFVLGAENAYIDYMINENDAKQANFSRLQPYLLSGSQIDKALRKVDVEWNIRYDSRVNDLISAENFIPYGNDCFTCDFIFKVTLKKYRVESDFSGKFRWTFVRTEQGWKAVEMELLS